MDERADQIAGIQAVGGAQVQRLAEFTQGFFMLPEALINNSQIGGRHLLARIDLRPKLVSLAGLFQVAVTK